VANLFRTLCTKFYQNWPRFTEHSTKTRRITFLYNQQQVTRNDNIVHALQNTLDLCINSARDRRGYSWNAGLPNSVYAAESIGVSSATFT